MNDFIISNIMLGIGLAMDAFSVSLANGMGCTRLKAGKIFEISGIFGAFQTLMPLIGWICVHNLINYFRVFQRFIPFIALILLLYIGGKMIYEAVFKKSTECEICSSLTITTLIVQGIATSIDALSVGFTIAEYNLYMAIASALIIGAVTLVICTSGVVIGKKFGTIFAGKAQIFGGLILVAIGIKIFVTGL